MSQDADLHGRALAVLSEALARPESTREAFVIEACGGDEALLAEVRSLLEHDAVADALEPGDGARLLQAAKAPPLEPHSPDETLSEATRLGGDTELLPGMTIGPYKLLQQIGEGGFGTVYAAEQSKPLRRRVALKVLKAGMGTKEVLARFDAERNALSLLNHPGIARVHEAGATPAGRPYFAMEYVEGIPITEFCDLEELPIVARLRLFLQVCDAVQHAHQMGIIHRDIKPSNILVMLQDGKPVPKVIDFGIAKATAQPLSEQTIFTLQGQLIGTPEYMSPEQAEMSGVGVDSTTDIYSLGVLLYELLTGVLPFDSDTLRRAGFAGIHQVLRDVEPKKPSTRVSTVDDATTIIGRHRRTDPRTLRRDLSGDLDWIVMRAMEKQRTRRYASASEFAADVRRHLEHEPVLAGPPGAGYRTRKFVRRHRVGVSFAIVVLLLLVGGIVATTLAMLDAARERDDAEASKEQALGAQHVADEQRAEAVAQREQAEENLALATTEGARARAVTDFLLDTLGLADPDETKLPEMNMADALDAAAAQVGERFADYPENEAEIRLVIGRAYDALGRPDLAFPHLRAALDLQRRVLGNDTLAVIEVLMTLFPVAERLNNHEWLPWAHELYALSLQVLARTDPELAWRFAVLVAQANDDAVPAARIRAWWNALREPIGERVSAGDISKDVAGIILYGPVEQLGWRSYSLDAAEMIDELRAAGSWRRTHRKSRRRAERSAFFRLNAGDVAGAKTLAEEQIAALTAVLGAEHIYLEEYRSVLAACLTAEGRYDEAQVLLEHCLAAFESSVVPDNITSGTYARVRLARVHEAAGSPEQAVPHRQAAIDSFLEWEWPVQWRMVREALMPRHAPAVVAYDAVLELTQQCALDGIPLGDRRGELVELSRRLLEARRLHCPDDDPACVLLAAHMAALGQTFLEAEGMSDLADELLVEALRIHRLHPERRLPFRTYLAGTLRELRLLQEREDEARALAREIDELVAEFLPGTGEHDDWSLMAQWLIESLVGRPGLAPATHERLARWAVASMLWVPGRQTHHSTAGAALFRAGRYAEALEQLATSDALVRAAAGGAEDAGEPRDLAFLAMAHHALGQGAEAAAAMTRLRAVSEGPAGADPQSQAWRAEAEAGLARER